MLKITKKEYNTKLDDCRCKACLCENTCFENGENYYGSNKDCKNNTCLCKDAKTVIKKAKLTVEANYRY